MREMSTTEQDEVGAAMGRLLSDVSSASTTVLITVGLRTGLWDALAERAGTADDVAQRAGVATPYARDWLRTMTAAGYLTFDPSCGRFGLTGGIDAVMVGPLRGLAEGTLAQLGVWWGLTARYAKAYTSGEGISWAELPPVHAEAMDQISRVVVVPG